MKPLNVLRALLLVFGLAALSACRADGERVFVVVGRDAADGAEVRLETHLYKPAGDGPFPLLIISHGSAGPDPHVTLSWRREAEVFVKQGFVVVAPMRRGRGQSGGTSPESEERNCELSSWDPGIDASLRDMDVLIDYAQSLPYVQSGHVVLVGSSRGGFLSLAYAARGARRQSVRSVINVSGGWVAQAEDRCPDDFNSARFAQFGAQIRVPTLWLYGVGDLFYGDEAVRSYVDDFRAAGGSAQFEMIGGVAQNGHFLSSYPEKWTPRAVQFLALPAAR